MKACHTQIAAYHNDAVRLPSTERTTMRERRNSNRDRLKKGLERDGRAKPVGCHTQGSYAMHTMVQDENSDYDIDDGVYFEAADLFGERGAPMTSLQVRQMVCAALSDNRFAEKPEVQKNCVRVQYAAGYHVDVPAYRRTKTTDIWTNKTVYTYELASSSWKASDPKSVTAWFRDTNTNLSSSNDGEGQFRRIVRLLKMFARSRVSWKGQTASGFMITKLASEQFSASPGRDDESFRNTMSAIERRLQWNQVVAHPVLNENITSTDDPRPAFFQQRLAENLKHLSVLDAHDCSHASAMAAWDKVFATTWFSTQPDPADGGGKGFEPSSPVTIAGQNRFA
jgi:hypothetical protein